jgi:hypothetical protein
MAPDGRLLHPSGSAESDRHRAILDDDGDLPLTFGMLEHSRKVGRVLLDIDVFERDVPPGVLLTGGFRVGSGVLPENQNRHTGILLRGRCCSCENFHIA